MIELTASFPSAAVFGLVIFLIGLGAGYLIRYLIEPKGRSQEWLRGQLWGLIRSHEHKKRWMGREI